MQYVMSDIHGRYIKFRRMLEKINFGKDDELYVIGDVIDRGPHSTAVLQDVLSYPNMHLILGNHEDMMLRYLTSGDGYMQWIRNGGGTTYYSFLNYPENVRRWFLSELEKCPVSICVDSPKGTFCLSHASPPRYREEIILQDSPQKFDILWSRDIPPLNVLSANMMSGIVYIIGHTPVFHTSYGTADTSGNPRISRIPGLPVINVDCGCAGDLTLGCLCLDNMEEFYIDKEDVLCRS